MDNIHIISDNCWGQGVYNKINLPYYTPFISLYIHTPDYIKLLSNLDDYLNSEFTLIDYQNSNHCNVYKVVELPDQIIGKLNDIEIIFYHCTKSADEIFDNWYRRKERLPKDKNEIVVKLCNQFLPRECKQKVLYENFDNYLDIFYKLPYYKKLSLTDKLYKYPNNYKILKRHFEDNLKMGREYDLYFDLKDIT